MTYDEYGQLVEFIGRKFDGVDRRFERVDARFEQVATTEEVRTQQAETRRHFDVANRPRSGEPRCRCSDA